MKDNSEKGGTSETSRPRRRRMNMETASKPLKLDPGPQLLVDDYLVDDIWMIRRSPELPVKNLDNPISIKHPKRPEFKMGMWTVLYDEDEKIFKCGVVQATAVKTENPLSVRWDTLPRRTG